MICNINNTIYFNFISIVIIIHDKPYILFKQELNDDINSRINVHIYVWYEEKMYVSKILSVSQLIPSIITFTTIEISYIIYKKPIILIITIVNKPKME